MTDGPGGEGAQATPAPERLPEMAPVEVIGTDADGDPIARPLGWPAERGPPPVIFMRPEAPGQPALAPGERVLARLKPAGRGKYLGSTFRRLGHAAPGGRILGVYEDGRILPVDRRHRAAWAVPPGAAAGAAPGDLVLAEPLPGQGAGPRPARILERLGPAAAPGAISLLCVHAHGIPDDFEAAALAEAAAAEEVSPAGREDLRGLPFVTIDGATARDFDDAVWAAAEGDDGWRIMVAIADVAHYVRPGSALDTAAALRGNSVYFPDRVVPMLPAALSEGWCSLQPGVARGCLFVELRIDTEGAPRGHRFGRGLLRSAARLTYEAIEAGADPSGTRGALYGAFAALDRARARRGALDLAVPERQVRLDAVGQVLAVEPRPRLASHRLIEAFMIAANVCAAETLERVRQPCLYRVHDRPGEAQLETLRQLFASLGIALPPPAGLRAPHLAAALATLEGRAEAPLVHEAVLRGLTQAAYAPANSGHFGLALGRYAHFTSPIRRYADLLIHRALIQGLGLGPDGLAAAAGARFPAIGEHITATERRAVQAERDALDRYLAVFMSQRQGEVFEARISGVTRFGLFVTVGTNGARGLIPLASLPDDRWIEDKARHGLSGQRTGLRFALGEAVEARLVAAETRTGRMTFHLMQGLPVAAHRRAGRTRGGRQAS